MDDLSNRFADDRQDEAGPNEAITPLVDQHLSALGQTVPWSSGVGRSSAIDPLVADALRREEWGQTLVSTLRYAALPTKPVATLKDRRARLRRFMNALNYVMGLHPDLEGLEIRDDMALLGLTLDALESGVVHPMIRRPPGPGNKAPDTKLSQQFRVYNVAFVIILIQAGMKRVPAFKFVAEELTRHGLRARRGKDKAERADDGDAGGEAFSWDTVKGWYYRAQPGHAERTGRAEGDAMQVAKIIISFVNHALTEKQEMPPSIDYAARVIRATMQEPAYQALMPMSGAQ